ncbi:MAG: hypothetical protein WAO74_08545 [Polaribacter sp.]|uniref:hypothetical protein n=1 Tax=Polaribacter sp. TaxID=1920175 RepID=UPI003BB1F4F0
METNKLDKSIQEKFENRTFKPSASAWERLSVQLGEQPKQKKIGWFFYIGAAASILLLVSIGIQLFSEESQEIPPKEEIVITPIDTTIIDKKIEKFKNEIPVQEALVQKNGVEVEHQKEAAKKGISAKENSKTKIEKPIKKEKMAIAKVEEKKEVISTEIGNSLTKNQNKEIEKRTLQQNPNSSIKINSDDLLYAVTHTPKEVKEYYAKYNLNREDILKTIKSELKKSNLKINPETILAEVERTINDDDFQNNFMKSLKRRVTDIASAIASRND